MNAELELLRLLEEDMQTDFEKAVKEMELDTNLIQFAIDTNIDVKILSRMVCGMAVDKVGQQNFNGAAYHETE